MKIAIIGTTPIMVLKALLLSKNHDVTIFEKTNKLGGAWSFGKFKNFSYPEKTNIIVPDNKSEEKFMIKIKKYLNSNFKVKIHKNQKRYSNITLYKPKKVFIFDINHLFKILKKSKIKLKKKSWVKSLKVKRKIVIINSKLVFNKVYIPFFINLENVTINNKKYFLPFKKVYNKHVHFITKKKFSEEFYYLENYNKYLDRAQLLKHGSYYFFTARVRKIFKHLSLKKIFKLSKFNIQEKNLLKLKLIKYTHHFRDKSQIKMLLNIKKHNYIKIIDTRQFVDSFKKLKLI